MKLLRPHFRPVPAPRPYAWRMGRALALLGLALAAAGFWAQTASADIVELKSGWRTEGEVEETETHVIVTLPSGLQLRYPRENVARIIRQDTPAQIFEERFAAIDREDVAALEELARWCRLNGLGEQAARVGEALLEVDPDNEIGKSIVIRDRMAVRSIPRDPEKDRALADEFGIGFRVYASRHFRIAYSTDEEYARERAAIFETLYEQFYRHFDRMGLPLHFLDDRVEVVLFGSQREFAEFAESRFPPFARSGGFYSPGENRAFFFDATGGAEFLNARREHAEAMRRLRGMRDAVRSHGPGARFQVTDPDGSVRIVSTEALQREIVELARKAREQWAEFNRRRQGMNVSIALHECAHQLAFNLGVHPDPNTTPRWLAEGIATFFEYTRLSRTHVATGDNPQWLERFGELRPRLAPLQDILTGDSVFLHFDERTDLAYAQSWALFRYLSDERQEDLVRYLAALREKPSDADSPESRLRDFEEAFGPLDEVDAAYKSYIDALLARRR